MKNNLLLVLIFLVTGVFAYTVTLHLNAPKVGMIRTSDFLSRYIGMQEAKRMFEGQQQEKATEIENLVEGINAKIAALEDTIDPPGLMERNGQVKEIAAMRMDLMRMKEEFSAKMQQEDEELTAVVLNQANEFLDQFGKEHGYDIIFGTNNSGTLLYMDGGHDITEEALEELNASYGSVE